MSQSISLSEPDYDDSSVEELLFELVLLIFSTHIFADHLTFRESVYPFSVLRINPRQVNWKADIETCSALGFGYFSGNQARNSTY